MKRYQHSNHVEMIRKKLDKLLISDYHGLNSPGLTCYLNSVLQVLFMTKDFREAVKGCCNDDPTTFDSQLGNLFAVLEGCMAKTHDMIRKLGITDVYKQQDAAEYLEKILCLSSMEASKIFKGELTHGTICHKCKEKNDCRSFFWILPLAVQDLHYETCSVETQLKALFNAKQVYGDNKIYCNGCDKKQDADIKCELTQSPKILTLLLKRFHFDSKHKCYVKLHSKVDVPQTLHIESCRYDLYALVNHFGDLIGGHYTAEIKSFETGGWYHFNDDRVKMVLQPLLRAGNISVRSNTAYLLMYKKVSNPTGKTVKSIKETQETMIYHHQPKDYLCSREQNLKDNYTLKKSHDDNALLKKQTCCELDQPQHRIRCRNPEERLFQRSVTADGFGYSLQTQMVKYNVQFKKSRDKAKREKWK